MFVEFAQAIKHGLDLDFHADETDDIAAISLKKIAEAALWSGFEGNILVGHCCSLARQPDLEVLDTLDKVAKAGLAIVSLPMCNLYLQDRRGDATTPRWRGVTLLHEMKARGIPVSVASDNTRDPFYAYGDLDMLEVFREATRILHTLTESASGPRRAELGATLASALIDGGREGEALDVLARTGGSGLKPELAERRALLRADALLGDGDTVRALDALRGLNGAEAARLRAQGLFAAGEWRAARNAFVELAATGAEPTADDLALQGLSAYLAGDAEGLRTFGEAQRARLAGTRWAGLVDALAPPPADGPLRAETVERDLATATALDRLARGWRGKP